MKLMPASSAAWMIAIESSWSVLPHAPNIIAPRHSGLTLMPVAPSLRCSIRRSPLLGRSSERLADHGMLGGGDLVEPADGCREGRLLGDLRVLGRLGEDRRERLGERVER